mgnify:CR=1 FL=1
MNFENMNRKQISYKLVPWLKKAKHWNGIRLWSLFSFYIYYLLTASINFSSITVSMWDSANISRWLRHWFHASKLPCCFECFLSRRATVCNNFAVRYCTNIIKHKSHRLTSPKSQTILCLKSITASWWFINVWNYIARKASLSMLNNSLHHEIIQTHNSKATNLRL